MSKNIKLLYLIPALWASLFDISITIVNQSKDYWAGNLSMANEGNPIGNHMMTNHISGIFTISIFWIILISVLGFYLPRKASRIFLLFVFIAHSWGGSTWISMQYGFWFVIIYMFFNSCLFYTIEDMVKKKSE
jgi:hypothetical protein